MPEKPEEERFSRKRKWPTVNSAEKSSRFKQTHDLTMQSSVTSDLIHSSPNGIGRGGNGREVDLDRGKIYCS